VTAVADGSSEEPVGQIVENPLVDVAAYLFLEDIADTQGAAGMNNYLVSLANSLARSMPEEEYPDWDSFEKSLASGNSILSAFETVRIAGSRAAVTEVCPFRRGYREYIQRVGEFAKIHYEVAEYYNSQVQPSAIDTQCIIHQTFRKAACSRIKVAGKPLQFAHLACTNYEGKAKVPPEQWQPILLEKAGLSLTEMNMLLRSNSAIWILWSEDRKGAATAQK
jgi:hypothetical protein